MKDTAKAAIKRLLRPFSFSIPATLHGRRYSIPIVHGVGSSHRYGIEPWMVGVLQTLFRLSGRAGLLDVGVNIGQTLLKLRSFDNTCPYVGFEPSAFCVFYVNQLIERNRLSNCVLVPVALSQTAGLTALETTHEGDSGASIVEGLRGEQQSTKEHVVTMPLDLLSMDVSGIPVVKIDVEGAELDVLMGMRTFLAKARPFVLCEVLHAHSPAQLEMNTRRNADLMRLLTAHGYSVLRLRKGRASVVGVEPVQAFPDDIYRWDSQQFCDYLFVSQERLTDVYDAMGVVPSLAGVGASGSDPLAAGGASLRDAVGFTGSGSDHSRLADPFRSSCGRRGLGNYRFASLRRPSARLFSDSYELDTWRKIGHGDWPARRDSNPRPVA